MEAGPPAFDLLRSDLNIWSQFSGEQEYAAARYDRHGRYVATSAGNGENCIPSVSRFLFDRGMRATYPGGHKFAVCLTHDVDELAPPLRHVVLSSVYCGIKRDFGRLKQQVLSLGGPAHGSPYYTFQKIMDVESRFGARSTFFFMAAKRNYPKFDEYAPEDVREEIRDIVSAGWDIGLHVGYYSYDKVDEIIREKERLEEVAGRKITGCRNHYLRFSVPRTWDLLSRAGLKYDTTFGYSNQYGFRNGMCHPFRPVDLRTSRQIDIVEIPLHLMDTTLVEHMTMDAGKPLGGLGKLVDSVADCNGVLQILWHTTIFGCPFMDRVASLYEPILSYCREKGAWLASAEDIYRWFCGEYVEDTGHRRPL